MINYIAIPYNRSNKTKLELISIHNHRKKTYQKEI
jgi:hypothetical protein